MMAALSLFRNATIISLLLAGPAFAQVFPSPRFADITVDGTLRGQAFINYFLTNLASPTCIGCAAPGPAFFTTVTVNTIAGVWAGAPINLATQVTGNLPVTNLGGGTGANNTTFWRGDGTWAVPPMGGGGGGGVSTVTWTGGIVSIANPTTAPAFTIAGTIGGIPYFNSASTWTSTGTLGLNSILIGGGVGAGPTSIAPGATNQLLHGATGSPPLFSGLTAQDLYQAAPCSSGQVFYNNAGAIGCTSTSGGTVTGVSFTGGLISVATPTSTPALTVAGTSGGIPYFSSGTTWASSAALVSGSLVVGGGAGAAPSTPIGLGTLTAVLHGNAGGNPSFGPVVSGDTSFTTPAATDSSTLPATTAWVANQKQFSSLQSFGAAGDGVTNDTTAVQTALNSGKPLSCNGSFVINSLITVTNTSVYMLGSHQGCKLILNNAQAMFYFTLTGNTLFSRNTVFLRDIYVSVTTAITNVTGPAQTAAFYITYPLGSGGTASPLVDIDHMQIQGSASGNYILNGLYFNDAVDVQVRHLTYEGNRASFNINTNGVVFDGTHTPALLDVEDSLVDFAGNGVLAKQEATAGWQGLKVVDLDCIYCDTAVRALGSLDGTSDQLVVSGSEGPVQTAGVVAQNVIHANIGSPKNYFFLADMPIAGGSHAANPVCYQDIWNIAIPANGATTDISGNSCDGAQVTGYTNRYGIAFNNSTSTLGMASHIGVNDHTSIDIAVALDTNTRGVLVEKQTTKGVTTEISNLSVAGTNTYVPPLAVTDGASAAAGLVGEVMRSTVTSGSAVSLVNGTAKTVTSLSLTAGDWDCRGTLAFLPNAATTISVIAGGLNTTTNILPGLASFFLDAPFATGIGASNAIAPQQINVSATTPLYMIAQSNFAANTMAAYGTEECRRMR